MKDFILPDIGEGIVECEIVEWHVHEGDTIKEDQSVCDVMTDKALVEIPSIHTGKISKLYYKKGDIAKVHSPLFSIEIETTSDSSATKINTTSADKQHANDHHLKHSSRQTSNNTLLPKTKKKAISSPAVRRLAQELNIDLTQVAGSGIDGRIYKEDIYAFQHQMTAPVVSEVQVTQEKTLFAAGHVHTKPITGMMAVMAKHMIDAVQTIPHFTFCDEVDLTALVSLRQQVKATYQQQGIKLTMMPFFIKALSMALQDYPQINVQTNNSCTDISYFSDHNIGVAVDSKVGLLVPNIKYCQNKSIHDIATELTQLLPDAQKGRVSQESIKGGTITISNIGAIGGIMATPIINKPEAAIVAIGKIQKLPRFNSTGGIEARKIAHVSWSADHRIIDGATITRFNNQWKVYLENPAILLTLK